MPKERLIDELRRSSYEAKIKAERKTDAENLKQYRAWIKTERQLAKQIIAELPAKMRAFAKVTTPEDDGYVSMVAMEFSNQPECEFDCYDANGKGLDGAPRIVWEWLEERGFYPTFDKNTDAKTLHTAYTISISW